MRKEYNFSKAKKIPMQLNSRSRLPFVLMREQWNILKNLLKKQVCPIKP